MTRQVINVVIFYSEPKHARRTFYTMLKDYCRKLGISPKMSTHSFRKYLATSLIRANANPAAVQQILGHASLETLSHYVNLVEDDLRKTLVECHPRG